MHQSGIESSYRKSGEITNVTIGGCATDIGAVRSVNQDAILYRTVEQSGQRFVLGVICDGIGGLEHGEIASHCVCQAAEQWFDNVAEWINIRTIQTDILLAHFKDAVEEWNGQVRDIIKLQKIHTGTTMSAIMILRNEFYMIHVGDSRIYQYRKQLQQITMDESIAKVQNGKMKLYLDNYLGKQDELTFKEYKGKVDNGDVFLYGSDGFYHQMQESDVFNIKFEITKKAPETVCRELIEKMIQRGETDNISIGFIVCN